MDFSKEKQECVIDINVIFSEVSVFIIWKNRENLTFSRNFFFFLPLLQLSLIVQIRINKILNIH